MGLFIMDILPSFHKDEDVATILWAIYYSRNSAKTKSALILEVINKDNIAACIEDIFGISCRIDDYTLMEEVLKRYG